MSKNPKEELPLRSFVVVSKLPVNGTLEYHLNEETEWVNELLEEMCEHASDFTLKLLRPKAFLKIDLSLTKKTNPQLGDYVLVKGSIESNYATECVKTLRPMTEKLSISFNSCYLSEELNTPDQFAEQDEIYLDHDIYQIYYHKKNQADLKEMLHEVIYLHYNQYPSIEANTERIVESD